MNTHPTSDTLSRLRKLAKKAVPGPYVAQDDRGWATPCIGRITTDPPGYTLMRGLSCTIGKWEREMEQAEFWAALSPEVVLALVECAEAALDCSDRIQDSRLLAALAKLEVL
jgi:hypothetical protein